MKSYFFILCYLTSFLFFGQKNTILSIQWKQEYESVINNNIWTGTNISYGNNFIPIYQHQWEKDNVGVIENVTFYNIVTKKISKQSLLNIGELPKSFNPELKIVKGRGVEFFSVKGNPIYINKNSEIIQVQSFELSYKLNNTKITPINYKLSEQNVLENSVLSSGTWYKFAIDKTGVFKIDASFLKSLGIDTSSLNPNKIRIFGNGGAILPELLTTKRIDDLAENAILVSGDNDGVFNDNDFIMFYAKGPVSWSLDSRDEIEHKQNIYSDYSYYFINVDSGIDGKRIIDNGNISNTTTIKVNTFTDYKVHEEDSYSYEIRTGRKWFGEEFTDVNEQNFVFEFPNINQDQHMNVNAVFSAKSSSVSTVFSVSYNNSTVFNASVTKLNSASLSFFNTNSSNSRNILKPISDNIDLNVSWNNKGDLSSIAYLDYIEVIADRNLIATGNQFGFLNFESVKSGEVLEYEINNDTEIDYIWNVTDFNNPVNMVDADLNSTVFKYKELSDGELNKYHVVKTSETYDPIKLEESVIENQNLHALKDIQYIIVTQKDFIEEANRMRDYHRNNTTISEDNLTNIKVEVVDIDQIYNEFGSGSPDITAIRDFAKFLYDNSSSEDTKLKYLCLFGDASFDFKNISNSDKTQIVPTYQSEKSNNLATSYSSDDYYGYLDETDDTTEDGELNKSGRLDITTGRIPVDTPLEASGFVDKLLNYYSSNTQGDWKNKITLLGDDGAHNDDQDLIKYLENSSKKIEENNPDFNISKLYTDAFKEEVTSGGGSYPEITKKFHDAFNNGSLVINYFGHGNNYNLGEETFLDIATIRSFRNINNLPLFITVTCDFSKFDDPTITPGGEELMNNREGGTIAMVATTREIYITSGRDINIKLAEFLYSSDGLKKTAAEVLKDAKNNLSLEAEFFVFFLGDPAMKLSSPDRGIKISKVEKVIEDAVTGEISLEQITELNALSKVKVTGTVNNDDDILTDFKGTLYATLYDKEIDRETLLNEGSGTIVEFKSLENKVFVGEASVNNGEFSFDFVLSKDVSVFPENAKFSFYAVSDSNERVGSDFAYKIGGIDDDALEDNTPPVIELYMGDETFVDGGNTNTTPKLLAKINDKNGINTSLNSIGHNITLVVDGDTANPITLNEYYTTEKDNFTNGIVSYELSELPIGNHTITFKVWDTHNNSSTQTLSFYVQEDKGFKLNNVLNYPNPFVSYTEFWFKNNRTGNSPINIMIQIYTLSGKLIKTIYDEDANLDDICRKAKWDGKDDYGNKLGKGVYIYKLTVKEKNTGQHDEKIEKLVIL